MPRLPREWPHTRALAAGIGAIAALAMNARADPPAAIDPTTTQAVAQLADASPAARDAARDKLLKIGRPARPALLAAAGAGPIRQRQAARMLLRQLPLSDDSDPPALRAALAGYVAAPQVAQADHALRLLTQGTDVGLSACARIILEAADDDDTLWTLVSGMSPDDQQRVVKSREFDGVEPLGPARLYLVGTAIFDQDRPRAVALLERCLAEISIAPPAAMPAIRRLADCLATDARAADDPARELRARCDVAMLTPITVTSPDGLPSDPSDLLLAYFEARVRLHSLDGFEEDLTRLGVPGDRSVASLVSAAVPAFRSATPAHEGDPMAPFRRVPAAVWTALDAMDGSDAIAGAEMLARAGEPALADTIAARLLLTMAGGNGEPTPGGRLRLLQVRAGAATTPARRSAALAALRDDLSRDDGLRNVVAAPRLPAGMGNADEVFLLRPVDALLMRRLAELRRAMESRNFAAADAILDGLIPFDMDRSEYAIDAIYALESRGRIAEADEIYLSALDDVQSLLGASPDEAGALNRVAWFCARTGHDLQYAYTLAARAMTLDAPNPARLDTFAECAHRLGKSREAVDAETRALELQPGDEFMTRQLDRFKAGLASGDAERAMPSESWRR